MIMKLLTAIFLLFLSMGEVSASFSPDSISYYMQNGIRVVIHEVEKGETLEGISRKYNVPVSEILKYNPGVKNGTIRDGQILKIPRIKGREKSNEASYVIHTVVKGETLYSLSKKYNVPIGRIVKLNTGLNPDRLREGQKLKIPIAQSAGTHESSKAADPQEPVNVVTGPDIGKDEYRYHIVEAGETMYGISRKYKVKVTDIMDWNGLQSFDIEVGQRLIVGKIAEEKKEKAGEDEPIAEEIMKDGEGQKANRKEEEVNYEKDESFEAAVNELSLEYEEVKSTGSYKEENEKAVTRWMKDVEGFPASKGYFALHRTLPIGTILRVENPVNGRYVFAKVIGHLPQREENKDIQMKLPESAGKELKAFDDIALLEIYYLKEKKGGK